MQHVDPEVLALVALGEDPATVATADERAHLETCALCAAEVAELAGVAETGRTVTDADRLVAPPPEVWERVRAELGLGDAVGHGLVDERTGGATAPGATPATVADGPAAPAPADDLAARRAARSRGVRRAWVGAAAGVALVAGVAGGVLWERREQAPSGTTLATAVLDALPDWPDAAGEARLEETPDGLLQVVVQVDAPAPADAYREVWLIADDLSGLVSLGVLETAEGRFDVPAGLDLDRYTLVDVSEEPFDGDPAHSGDSVVRGALES